VVSHRRLLAVLAGAALAASVSACGERVRGGIPEADATVLQREIADVERFVASDRCGEIEGQLRQVDERIDNLPSSVSERLEENLRAGADRLRAVAVEECNEAVTAPETPESTEPTPAEEETTTPEQEEPATGDDGTGTGDDGGTDGGTEGGGNGTEGNGGNGNGNAGNAGNGGNGNEGNGGGGDGGTETPAPETPTPEQPEGGTPGPEEGTTP